MTGKMGIRPIKQENLKWPCYNENIIVKDYCIQNVVIAESGWNAKSLCEAYIEKAMTAVKDSKDQKTTFVITDTGAIEAIKKRSNQQS